MNRIISLFLFIFVASCLNAQYNTPIRNKVTLGKQTTADGLVWRGQLADTANLLTNKLDTSVYIVLDTGTRAMWYYRASTTPKWTRLVDSLNNLQGTLSVAKGGTGSATQNFVDLTTTQSIGGAKTFTSEVTATRFNPTANTATGTGMFLPAANTLGFSTNGTEKVQITSGGNVGIGTTSPKAKLDVAGAISTGNGSTTRSEISSPVGSGNASLLFAANAGNVNTSTAEFIWTNSLNGSATRNELMRITSAGNVGIGTSSPYSKLTIHSTASTTLGLNAQSGLVIGQGGATNDLIQIGFNQAVASTYSPAVISYLITNSSASTLGDILFSTRTSISDVAPTERMRITSGGNVGIGTTAPGASLHVAGAISSTPTGSGFLAGIQGNYGVAHLNGSDGGLIDFSVSGTDTRGRIIYTNSTNAMGFGTTDGVTKMTLDASGNLGLGVTPSAWLSTYRAIDIQNYGAIASRSATNSLEILTNAYRNSAANYIYKNNGTAQYIEAANGAYAFYTAGSGTAGNAITFTQAMTLDASGNLLVGTITNPYSKGRLVVSHTSNYDRSIFLRGVDFIEISPSGLYGSVNFITSNYTSGGSVFSPLALSARQNTADLYLSTSGNVGIGTASPGYTLQIKNSDASATVSSADGTAEMRINAQSGLAILETITNTDLRIRTNSTERMRITSGGNVGIGTTSPAKILTIAASSETWAGAPQVAFYDTFSGQVDARNWTVGAISTNFGNFTIASSTAAGGDPTTPRLTINKDGNVGIGTASTTARLHVKGVDVTDSNFALKVEDSNNLNLLSVKNNGDVTLKNPLSVANGGTGTGTAFTQGSVVFAGASGTYTQDNSGLFFDNTNNRLGINTAAPEGLLEARSTVGGTQNGLFSLYENSGTSPYFTFRKARGTPASPSAVQLNDGMGELSFQGYHPNGFDNAVVLRSFNYLAPGASYLNGGFKILINSQAGGGLVEYLNIISNGNTGIGDNLVPTERLHVGGNVRITAMNGINDIGASATGVLQAATSDINLKNTIENSPFGLNEILLLKPVTFLYNDENRKIDSDVKEVGFIAQDVFDVIPNAVSSTGTGDLQLDYRAITATLVKAIQEQNLLIKALEQRILILENK